MKGMSIVLALLSGTGIASAQGLTDPLVKKGDEGKPAPSYELEKRVGRNRLDLHLSPNLQMPRWGEEKSLGLSGQADLRMICGLYDLKATFKHLLGKEAREEFLDNLPELLLQEVVGSGMDLLCQAEPTICNLLQNYSISANLKIGYYNDLCQAVEQSLVDARRKNHVSAVDACLREKQAQGYPLDRAMEACQKSSPKVSGFRGELLGEFDLGIALRDVLKDVGLSPGADELVDRLGEQTKIGGGSMTARPDPGVIVALYEKVREAQQRNLDRLIGTAAKGEGLDPEAMKKLVSEGAPPITEDEIRSLALLPPYQRMPVVASLASAMALYEMTRRIHEVERALEALKIGPTVDEGKRELLETRLARLRNEKRRLDEIHEEQARVMSTLAAAKGVAAGEQRNRISQVQSRTDLAARKRELAGGVRPWGALPARGSPDAPARTSTAKSQAANCGGCGLEYSFGAMGAKK